MRLALVVTAVAAAALGAQASVHSARAPAVLTFAVDAGRPTALGGLCFVRAGARAVRLTGRHDDRGPAWSRDGRHVAFTRMSGRRLRAIGDILVADGRGRVLRRISPSGELFNFDAAWSPDGRRIAFASGFRRSDVVLARRDGSGRRHLDVASRVASELRADSIDVSVASPTWAPDGRRFAVQAWSGGVDRPPSPSFVFVTGLDGTGTRRVVAGAAPAWSPRGGPIAYVADGVGGAHDVFVVNADGSDPRPVTRTADAEARPVWSPDGRRIAFERDEPGPGGAIVVANVDGTNERVAVRSNRYRPAEPAWRAPVALPRARRSACG